MLCFLLASCNETVTKSEVKETSEGYRYETISQGKGPKAVLNNYAYFNAEVVSLDGEVVFSSEESGQPGILKLVEPIVALFIDVPADYSEKVIQLVTQRKGKLKVSEPKGEVEHLEFDIPSSGSFGLRDRILIVSEGTATVTQGNGNSSPFSEILLDASVGDSIHIYLGKNQGAQGSGFDSLIYKVGFFEMADEAEYQSKLKAEQEAKAKLIEASKAVEKEIASKVSDYYAKIKSGAMSNDIQKTDSGLKYIIHEKGTGDLPELGNRVSVNYYGVLSRTGEEFDNSWKRGQPFSFPLGQGRVIKGWDEGVALLPKGSKATLIIPSDLGYGESGSGKIQPGDELIFYIEVDQ